VDDTSKWLDNLSKRANDRPVPTPPDTSFNGTSSGGASNSGASNSGASNSGATRSSTSLLRIDGDRLGRRLDELATIGFQPDGSCARLALTDEDRAGRDLVTMWMRDLGLEVSVDAIGNVVGLWSVGAGAPVMCGSHIDTVRTGGRFDGNYGVLSGLEVIETCQQAGIVPDHPLAVAFFTDEEGARFAPDMLGSLVYAGGLAVEEAHDIVGIDGARVGDELARIGYLGPSPCPGAPPHAFVELHIEQGPVLEIEGQRIGAVTGVQGISWQELAIEGQSNHAGTTPMAVRHDPAYAAARVTVFVRELALRLGGHQVATVGKIDAFPNLVNVVPARVRLTVDLRNTDEATLQRAEAELVSFIAEVETAEGVRIERRTLARFEPVAFDERVVNLVERIATSFGHATRRMPSGAGHDAQMLSRVCPTAMIFVPSAKGISHNPAEHTDPADLEAGANVLLHTMLSLANGDEV
jgi:N-carbamoyl-L-amino-acid hydrolase